MASTNLTGLLEHLGELHKEHADAELNTGDRVMEVLEQLGLADVVRLRVHCEMIEHDMIEHAMIERATVQGQTRKALPQPSRPSESVEVNEYPEQKPSRGKNNGKVKGTCSQPDCGREVKALGLCSAHYSRKRAGKDMDGPVRARRTAESKQKASAPIGHPVELSATVQDASGHHNGDCPAFSNCEEYATAKGWRRFSCNACDGPGKKHQRKMSGKRHRPRK